MLCDLSQRGLKRTVQLSCFLDRTVFDVNTALFQITFQILEDPYTLTVQPAQLGSIGKIAACDKQFDILNRLLNRVHGRSLRMISTFISFNSSA